LRRIREGDLVERRSDQIFAAWSRFHAEHPEVWKWFEGFAFEAIGSGLTRYSADAICHRIRWYVAVERRESAIKINNNFAAYYARLFVELHPQHAEFFERRELISERRDAVHPDIQEFVGPEDRSRHAGVAAVAGA
jgi:hypothetical protein